MRRVVGIVPLIIVAVCIMCSCDNRFGNISVAELESIYQKACTYEDNDLADSALIVLSAAANRFTPDLDNSQKQVYAKIINRLGYLYYHYYGNIPYAYESFSLAKKLSQETNDDATYGQICLNLAIINEICAQLGLVDYNDDYSAKYYVEGYDNAKSRLDWVTLLNCFANISAGTHTRDYTPEYRTRIEDFATITLPDSIPGKKFYINRLNTAVAIMNGDYSSAIDNVRKELLDVDGVWEKHRVLIELYDEISQLHLNSGAVDSALYYNNKALCIADSTAELFQKSNLLKNRYQIYNSAAKTVLADQALLRYYMHRDSVMAANNLMMIDNLEFVANIKRQNKFYSLTVANLQRRLLIYGFIAILAIITIPMLGVLHRRNKKLRDSYNQLYDRQQEILRQWDSNRQKHYSSLPRHRTLGNNDTQAIKDKILYVMDTSEEIFSPEFSLDRLSELVQVKPRVLSSVLNDTMNKSFYNLLNEYRVREACRRLEDKERYGHLTIEAISQGLGYKSRTTLVNVFKKQIGLTPTEYQRIAKQKNKDLDK